MLVWFLAMVTITWPLCCTMTYDKVEGLPSGYDMLMTSGVETGKGAWFGGLLWGCNSTTLRSAVVGVVISLCAWAPLPRQGVR